jgi:hypothetical protein
MLQRVSARRLPCLSTVKQSAFKEFGDVKGVR